MNETVDALVVGGGITGLKLASNLANHEGIKATLVSEDLGGLISLYNEKGFLFDFGGHVYTPDDGYVSALMARVGGKYQERNTFYDSAKFGRVPYPVQDYADRMDIRIDGKVEPYRGFNLESFATTTFGKQFFDEFFEPFTKRVWTTPSQHMDSDWIANRVKLPSEKKENWGPNSSFWYAPGYKIIDYLHQEARNNNVKIRNGWKVLTIDVENKKATFIRSDSGLNTLTVNYEFLFWTLPITYFLEDRTDFVHNKVRTIGVGFNHKINDDFTWVYCDLKSPVHRVTMLSRYHEEMAPHGKDSLLLEIPWRPGWNSPPLFSADARINDEYIYHRQSSKQQAIRAIKAALRWEIKEKDIAVAAIGETIGYPVPIFGMRKFVAEIKETLRSKQIIVAGRWGSWAYFNAEHCFMDADVASRAYSLYDNEPDRYITDYLYSSFYYLPYKDMNKCPIPEERQWKVRNVLSSGKW